MINQKRYKPVDNITVYFAIEYTGDNIKLCLNFDKHIGILTNLFEIHSSDDQYIYDPSMLVLILNLKSIKFIHPGSWIVRQHGVASIRVIVCTDELFKYTFVEDDQYLSLDNSGKIKDTEVIEDLELDE